MWIISHEYKIINTVKEVNNMKNEILIYNLPDGESNVEVYLNEDDIWMSKRRAYVAFPIIPSKY